MKLINYKKRIPAFLIALVLGQSATAQGDLGVHTPTSIELLKARSHWFYSTNSAGLLMEGVGDFGFLEAAYAPVNGDFKRPQQGQRESRFSVSTEGGQNIGRVYGWGAFEYGNTASRESRFNTAMLDPFRGTPFYPVDPNLSDWKKQDYSLRMKVAAPLSDRYALGLEAAYTTQTGAKQVDPRSEQYYYSINVKPAIVRSFGDHLLGLNVEYENMIQETRRHTNSNSQVNQDVYVMRGLGNHYTAVIGGLQSLGSFLYEAHKIGGGLQYGYQTGRTRMHLDLGYAVRAEDAIRDVSKPRKEGALLQNVMHAGLSVIMEDENLSRLDINYQLSRTDGIEFVQVLDNSFEVQQWVDLYSSVRSTYAQDDLSVAYNFYRKEGSDYRWRAGLTADYQRNDDLYIVPTSNLNVENLYLGANGTWNIAAGSYGRFSLGAEAVYKNNLAGDYVYGGADPSSIVIAEFMSPDFQYLKQNFYRVGGSIGYSTVIGQRRANNLFFHVRADYYKPTEGAGNRVQSSFGMGVTF